MKTARALPAIVTVALLLILGSVTPSQAAEAGQLVVNVQAIPTTTQAGEQLTIQGTVLNASSTDTSDVTVALRVQKDPLTTRSAVQAWESSRNVGTAVGPTTLTLPVTNAAGVIPAQGSAPWTLTIPSDTLGLQGSGSRGIVLQATSTTGRGTLRTYLTWDQGGYQPTRLTTIAKTAGANALAIEDATRDLPVTWLKDPGVETSTLRTNTLNLSWGNPDLLALSRTPRSEDLLQGGTRTLAWPEGNDENLLGWLQERKYQSVILPDTSLPSPEDLTYTPNAHGHVGDLSALVYDTTLSSLATTSKGTPAERSQRLVAELATLTLERPNAPRNILLALPSTWQGDPGSGNVIRNATSNPWVENTSVQDLQASPVTELGRYQADAEGALPTNHVTAVQRTMEDLAGFEGILVGNDEVTLDAREAILRAVSINARGGDLPGLRKEAQSQVRDLTSKVEVVPGSSINLAASEVDLPVTVRNALPVPVQVRVDLKGSRPLLRFDKTGTQRVEAESTKRFVVPVKALTNGNVNVTVNLVNAANETVSSPARLKVRVRMGLETSLGAILGVTGVIFVLGLYRNLKRGRRRTDDVEHPLETEGAADDDPPGEEATTAKDE